MTTLTSTSASARIQLPTYNEYVGVFIDGDAPGWKVVFIDDFADAEKDAIERRLDAEDSEPKIAFGSAKEAVDFLRSRIKRSHA